MILTTTAEENQLYANNCKSNAFFLSAMYSQMNSKVLLNKLTESLQFQQTRRLIANLT